MKVLKVLFKRNMQNYFQPRSTGEPKTKPTQSSVRELRGLGLSPDLIVCRSEKPIDDSVKEKISNFCHVSPGQVEFINFVKIFINIVKGS